MFSPFTPIYDPTDYGVGHPDPLRKPQEPFTEAQLQAPGIEEEENPCTYCKKAVKWLKGC